MKQYKIIPFYSGLYVITLAVGILAIALSVLCFYVTDPFGDILIGIYFFSHLGCGVFLISYSVYSLYKGFASGTYSIDTEGASTYIGKKTYRLDWKDCVEFGIAGVTVNWGSSVAIVYGTKKLTSAYERDHFLKCRKNDYENTFYFQYSDEEAFRELLDVLPEHAKAQLTAKVIRYPMHG